MSFYLHGLGTALPQASATQTEALICAQRMGPPQLRQAKWVENVYLHSGIEKRHQVHGPEFLNDILNETRLSGSPFLPTGEESFRGPPTSERMAHYAKHAPVLAVESAQKALLESGFDAQSITHLVTVSCTGFLSPGVDFALIQELGLPATVERTHVGFMGCHGAINGLRVAASFTKAYPDARVLVNAVELCTLHYYYGDEADKVVANAIFADGAASVVASGRVSPDRSQSQWQIRATGSCLIPNSAQDMYWRVGDYGFEMGLSRRIPVLIHRHLQGWLKGWLAENHLTIEQVSSWAIHPGGPKIISAVEEGLGLSPERVQATRKTFAEFGNMSSPTVLFILDRLRKEKRYGPCVMIGFGPGLVAEAILWDHLPPSSSSIE
ncbi:MAG: type III polyketide synthase [Gemmataceae bacterium]|jgi:predicted naringenin-chalcone synthase|nr:type III polyketide synthase [Gemmataceae bacterium]